MFVFVFAVVFAVGLATQLRSFAAVFRVPPIANRQSPIACRALYSLVVRHNKIKIYQ
jgi:hypothetical protein